MKKFKLVALFLACLSFLPSESFGLSDRQCRELLLGGELDNSYFLVRANQLEVEVDERDHLAVATLYVRHVAEQVGCAKKDLNFGKGPKGRSESLCRAIVKDKDHSLACYLETNLGYFFVMKDMLDNTHVIFNRWD